MLLQQVVDRATFIGEEFNDTEVAYAQIYDLYWTVLIAIANGQCEDASPKEFAAAVVGLEAEAADTFHGYSESAAEVRERLAGKKPEWLEPPQGPPPREPWHAPRAKRKKPTKKKPKLAKRKKRG